MYCSGAVTKTAHLLNMADEHNTQDICIVCTTYMHVQFFLFLFIYFFSKVCAKTGSIPRAFVAAVAATAAANCVYVVFVSDAHMFCYRAYSFS